MLLFAVSLRSWAFLYLGSSGRTRDPACPASRVVGGPYQWLTHPVYVSNILIALALVVAAAPGLGVAAALIALVGTLYLLLSARESLQLREVKVRRHERLLSARELARSERSTWLQLASFMAVLTLML
jgi:protein-S-isoprenylcysteine O-methyltransferase Ste14